ncbi:MAG: DUF4382 domain-containing protein [Candidatus Thermoplasmatota archaeon]|nr:DUF4382 domain-containing protein [Candidatus Thermoplasmatota archaeon]
MKKILILVILVTFIGAIVFSGCLQTGTGLLVLKITDKPGDLNITKANVNISQIKVHLSASGNDSNDTGWYTVVNESQTFDLIALQNVTELLGNVTLKAGSYTQIRLYIEKAVLTIDGVEYDCKIPSNTIKLISPFQISADNTTTLTLDFDIWESVHETGNGNYTFQPTIKIIQG